ncbi:MAG: VCBS repeat-containing protein, partial [Planctomycetota bacterium]
MTESTDTPVDPTEDSGDDIVIASALKKSLLALIAVAIPAVAAIAYVNLNRDQEEEIQSDVVVPVPRDTRSSTIPRLMLTEITADSGIDFVHETGATGEKLLPETMGSGVAVLDFNDDGLLDLLLVNSRAWPWAETSSDPPATCHVYAGNGDGTFRDVSEATGMDVSLYGMGVAVGDIDNDGDTDIFLSAVGKNRLMRNDDGVFVDVTDASGVGGEEERWSTSCGFFDFDNDRDLDLFVANYVDWSRQYDLSQSFTLDGENRAYGPPKAFSGTFNYLYRNLGDGTFEDVSESSGIQIRNADTDVATGKGMGVAPVDFNGDGWIDLMVANDTVRNFLFQNQRDGTFQEMGELANVAYDRSGNARGAMGIDCSVFRPDGTLAVGIGNFANEASALYVVRPERSQFVDAAMFTGFGPPTRQGLTFGLFFFDVDLDGRPDVLGANGHLEQEIAKTLPTLRYRQSPQLFW